MSRRPRPNSPGLPFHITARLQHRAHLFTPELRFEVVARLRWQVVRSDVRLLAYVIMTNHLHLVLVQGERPLGQLMQPFLTSIARAVQRTHGGEGHVFGARFADRICRNAAHLRNAIAYTHANPVRAGLCRDPADYLWSSHSLYMRGQRLGGGALWIRADEGLTAFSAGATARSAVRAAYASHLRTAITSGGDGDAETDDTPERLDPVESRISSRPLRPTLDDLMLAAVRSVGGTPSTENLPGRWRSAALRPARQALAIRAATHGYSGVEIAAFLGVSRATVSRLLG